MKTVSKAELKEILNKKDPVEKVDKDEPKIKIFIDPTMVGKLGIRINGKIYVGYVTVPESQAEDLLRIQSEFWETVKKMTNKYARVRMKSDFQKEVLFLADPEENQNKKNFSRDFGLLSAEEWSYCSEPFKKQLLAMREQMYGY